MPNTELAGNTLFHYAAGCTLMHVRTSTTFTQKCLKTTTDMVLEWNQGKEEEEKKPPLCKLNSTGRKMDTYLVIQLST